MSLHQLLVNLAERDIKLRAAGDNLIVDAPRGVTLTMALADSITHWKPTLLEMLRPDPRMELAEDSHYWNAVLAHAFATGSEPTTLAYTLHSFRCFGARLERTERGLRIRPRFAPEGMWRDEAGWQADVEKCLRPHVDELREIFSSALAAVGEAA